MTTAIYPPRVVDRDNQGWRSMGTSGNIYYVADMRRDLQEMSYGELDNQRGPLRPVEPITGEDHERLIKAFDLAGRKTVATVAAALETVHHQHRQQRGGLRHPAESMDYADRSMTAGRAGSWESDALRQVILVGNGFNLERPSTELSDVDAQRAAGPRKRVHREAHKVLVTVFQHWTSNPARYVEVAETLASLFGEYADERYGADGWNQISDQWLRPTALSVEDFRPCYRLLYSRSEYFDFALL